MKVVALVPVKMNNRRLPNKNVKPFTNGEPLITFSLKKLCQATFIDEAYVFCSDEAVKPYLPPGIRFLKRPAQLDSDETRMNAVIEAFIQRVKADIYLFTHVTSPFISVETLEKAVQAVASGEYDSAAAVELLHDFMWYRGEPLTYDPASIPRTQDMEPVYKETSGVYVFTHEVALKNRRIGAKPFFVPCSKIEAMDIDDAIDFAIADAVHSRLYSEG